MGELFATYKKWRDIIRATPSLLDGKGTYHTVDSLSSFGRIFLLEHRTEPQTPSAGDSKAPPVPRLTVDLDQKTITLDGKSYDVPSDNALRWVKVLADHNGDWISGPKLPEFDKELLNPRTDR